MALSKRLLIGLGNPGPKYERTRHNIGFWIIDKLADEWGVSLSHQQDALLGWHEYAGDQTGLVKPLRYVNRSGGVVKQLSTEMNVQPEDLLVIVDDLHLDTGVLRLRPRGGDAGHNGMRDIIQKLGTDAFPRLRIGIGNDYPAGEQADYVLSPFSPAQEEDIEFAMHRAVQAVQICLENGIEAAMNEFNG